MAARTRDLVNTTNQLRDHIADFDDFFGPIRNYFYWEPHCFDVPICWSLRSIFDSLDRIDETADKTQALQADTDHLASLTPQMAALIPPIIDTMKTTKALTLSLHSTFLAMLDRGEPLRASSSPARAERERPRPSTHR